MLATVSCPRGVVRVMPPLYTSTPYLVLAQGFLLRRLPGPGPPHPEHPPPQEADHPPQGLLRGLLRRFLRLYLLLGRARGRGRFRRWGRAGPWAQAFFFSLQDENDLLHPEMGLGQGEEPRLLFRGLAVVEGLVLGESEAELAFPDLRAGLPHEGP